MTTNNRILAAALFGASLAVAGPVFAQGGQGAAQQSQQGAAAQRAAPAAGDITDAQIEKFSDAQKEMLDVRSEWQGKMQNAKGEKAAMQQRQMANQAMVEAIQDSGLTVDEYNGIAKAAQSNPQIAQRIRESG